MPHPPRHNEIIFSGVFGTEQSPIEEWSFRFTFAPGQNNTVDDMEALTLLGGGAWSNGLVGIMPGDVVLTRIRARAVSDQGKTLRDANGGFVQYDSIVSSAGNRPVGNMPSQIALVVSLQSGRAGSIGKGRIFLPWVGYSPDENGLLTVGDQNLVADAMANAIGTIDTFDNDLVVASGGGETNGFTPVLSPVTSIKVGRVPDTMRSRRNRRDEGYVTRSI